MLQGCTRLASRTLWITGLLSIWCVHSGALGLEHAACGKLAMLMPQRRCNSFFRMACASCLASLPTRCESQARRLRSPQGRSPRSPEKLLGDPGRKREPFLRLTLSSRGAKKRCGATQQMVLNNWKYKANQVILVGTLTKKGSTHENRKVKTPWYPPKARMRQIKSQGFRAARRDRGGGRLLGEGPGSAKKTSNDGCAWCAFQRAWLQENLQEMAPTQRKYAQISCFPVDVPVTQPAQPFEYCSASRRPAIGETIYGKEGRNLKGCLRFSGNLKHWESW